MSDAELLSNALHLNKKCTFAALKKITKMKNITFIVAACCLMMAACAQSPKSAENQNSCLTLV